MAPADEPSDDDEIVSTADPSELWGTDADTKQPELESIEISPRQWAWLAREVDRWRTEGLVTDKQAELLRSRYESRPAEPETEDGDAAASQAGRSRLTADDGPVYGRSRLVAIVSLMGAVLVTAGIVVYLTANWTSISRTARAALLIAAPIGAFAIGWQLWSTRMAPRSGAAVWTAGSGLVGLALFMLTDLYDLAIEPRVLLAAWAIVAVPGGHLIASRLATVLGLAVVGALVITLSSPAAPFVSVAAYGTLLAAIAAAPLGATDEGVADAYRFVGLFGLVIPLLWAISDGFIARTSPFEPVRVWGPIALGAAVVLAQSARKNRQASEGSTRWVDRLAWPALSGAAAAGAIALAWTPPSALAGDPLVFVLNALCLAVLVLSVWAGYTAGSTALINAAIAAFVAQLGLFLLSTVIDGLSGPIALVVAGATLLAVGYGLERGRRSLFEQMRRR